MSVLKGYCQHGVLQAALIEEHADEDDIEEFAHSWRVEKAESAFMEGPPCSECRERYEANMRLINGAS